MGFCGTPGGRIAAPITVGPRMSPPTVGPPTPAPDTPCVGGMFTPNPGGLVLKVAVGVGAALNLEWVRSLLFGCMPSLIRLLMCSTASGIWMKNTV